MASIPITYLEAEGVELDDPLAATGDDLIENNDGFVCLELTNPTGGTLTCQIVATFEIGGVALGNRTITVPGNTTLWSRPIPPALYNDSHGDVQVIAQAGLLIRGTRF